MQVTQGTAPEIRKCCVRLKISLILQRKKQLLEPEIVCYPLIPAPVMKTKKLRQNFEI